MIVFAAMLMLRVLSPHFPDVLTIIEHHRFEGVSDPDDMSVVYGIEANDGTRGVLVDAYGVYADPRVSELLKSVKVREKL